MKRRLLVLIPFLVLSAQARAGDGGIPLKGSMAVSSKSTVGARLANPDACAKKLVITPSGQWTYWPFTGFHGAEGNVYAVADRRYPLPGAKEGGLLVQRGQGRLEPVAGATTLVLEANEVIQFRINDNGLDDNQGALLIDWQLARDCE
jgi:hypothetical protein